jgi:DUF1680 family protein
MTTRPGRRTTMPGPVEPTAGSTVVLRPLGHDDVVLTRGVLADRQRANRENGIALGATRLAEAGNLANLRAAAEAGGGEGAAYVGEVFMDSDVYKWLEAVAWEYGREPDERLLSALVETTALVAAAQQPDGYLNSYVQVTSGGRARYADLSFGHELYCFGHLIQAGIAARRATPFEGLFDVALRAADHMVETFGPDRLDGVDGHPLVETALVELFRETADARYLDLARFFVTARGRQRCRTWNREPIYFSDRVAPRDADTLEGHAVRAVYLAMGVADLVAEPGGDPDRALAQAQLRQWEHTTATKTYLTGGMGSRWEGEAFGDPYELPPDTAYGETCAAIASMHWNWRLLLQTGEARFADLLERTLYNGFLAGFSLDVEEFFYVNALQVRSGAVPDSHKQPASGRHGWFECACCPPNVMRTVACLQDFCATITADAVQLHLYASMDLRSDLAGGVVRLRVVTEYPADGRVRIEVVDTPDTAWSLSLRVPGWADSASVEVSGNAPETAAPGYTTVTKTWSVGDVVVLTLPVAPRLVVANDRVDAVRGCVAVERGPLVYTLEQQDQPGGVDLGDVRVESTEFREDVQPALLGGVTTLRLRGSIPESQEARPLYRSADGAVADRRQELELAAIPYYAWANREPGAMRVWIPASPQLLTRADHDTTTRTEPST